MSEPIPFPKKEQYAKPEVTEIDVANEMQQLELAEGQLYQRFNAVAEKLEEGLQAIELEMTSLSESLDELKARMARIQFVAEVREREQT